MTSFNIQIIDDFLPKKYFNKIKKIAGQMDWGALELHYEKQHGKHVWFSKNVIDDVELKDQLIKSIRSKTSYPIKDFKILFFTLAPKTEIFPHIDVGEGFKYQMILYVDGSIEMNKGTGFFLPTKTGITMNTHVGFNKNRAVFFNSGVWHSPLIYASDNAIPRISIIAQF